MKKNVWTKALSMLLALVMVVGMIPATAVAVFADGIPEALVTSLAGLYDGDEARAREELEALRDAGIIDENGNLAALDIREDGERVELSALAQRIASGEDVGAITVNGHDATTEQIVQIQQVNSLLELLQMIDKDVKITDEHVANLKALVEGIADGSIDLSNAIESGALTVSNQGNAKLMSANSEKSGALTVSNQGNAILMSAESEEEVNDNIVQVLYQWSEDMIPYEYDYEARMDLNALLSAGIIDSKGNFIVTFDLQESLEDVDLDAVAQHIQGGGIVGVLTINGNLVSPEFLTQIYMVKRLMALTKQFAETKRFTTDMQNEYMELWDYFNEIPDISADYLSRFAANMSDVLTESGDSDDSEEISEDDFNKDVADKIVDSLWELKGSSFLQLKDHLGIPYQSREDVKKDLNALHNARIISSDGKFVAKIAILQMNGKDVKLDTAALLIQAGETVDTLIINNNSVSPEFLTQIYMVKRLMAFLRQYDADLWSETWNESRELSNYFSNVPGISFDYLSKFAANMSDALRDPVSFALLPAEASDKGEVTTLNGKYAAPYINGSEYEKDHSFTASGPITTYWYSFDEYGIERGGVVSLSYSYGYNCVRASLNKRQPVDVSFDWKIVNTMDGQSQSGTVTWAAGDEEVKTIPLNLPGGGDGALWRGQRARGVFSASNIKNAIFSGGATAWNHVIYGTRDDQLEIAVSTGEFTLPTITADQFTKYDMKNYQGNYERWYVGKLTGLPTNISIARITPMLDRTGGNLYCTVYLVSPDADVGGEPVITYDNQRMDNFHLYYHQSKFFRMSDNVFTIRDDMDRSMSSNNKCTVSGATLVKKSSNKPDGTTDFENGSYTTNVGEIVSAKGEAWIVVGLHKAMLRDQIGQTSEDDLPPWTSTPDVALSKVDMHCWLELARKTRVEDINIPKGTYYSGEIVPITVTLSEYIGVDSCQLTVNNTSCPVLDQAGIWTKKLTFGYTVKSTDAASINVTGLSGLKTIEFKSMDVDGDFPSESFGPQEGVTLVSDLRGSLDMQNVVYGISDDKAGEQVVTVVIPFKSGAEKTWVVNEGVAINKALALPVPGYSDGEATFYLAGAYFSCDGGKTRYPVYLVNSGGQEGVALAGRFKPPVNVYPALRKDKVQLYIEPEIISPDTAQYLPAWDQGVNKPEDAAFDGTDRPDAVVLGGMSWAYYVKCLLLFDAAKYTPRNGTWEPADQGFIQTGGTYVLVGDAENPANRYDVEITANEGFFNAVKSMITVDSAPEMTLGYQISGRVNFEYVEPENFTWATSDSTIATVEKDAETGEGQIVLTGQGGRVKFLLTVGNGSAENAYTLETPYINILEEGSEPFLSIPKRSQIRTTLAGTDTDVAFTSNVTACNAALEKETVFTAKLYRVSAANETPGGDPIWTENFPSTTTKTVTHVTVPGNQLPDAGYYAVVIETRYEGGVVGGVETAALDLSATAYLNAKNPPARVTLNKLESYYVTSDKLPAIGYTVTPASAAVEYTIQKSGSPVGERTSVSSGTLPFTAETPTGLKDAYTITVYARNNESEAWSADSMLLTVYNKDALDIIIKDVAEGEIGGTTGGAGTVADNATIAMDNRDKLANYGVTDDNFQLTFDDFATLRTDMSFQKIISANYGTGVWGMLSDKMQWSSSDPDTVSVDYKQGGFYSDIRNYAYTSYIPTSDFLLVGKGDTAENVTITATHANTGMRETFDVTANALENELYLFQFSPKTTTTVTYTNGDGVERRLTSNDQGQLAVYEPEGITGTLRVMSTYDGETYVASLLPGNLVSGERDVTSLQLYACNNVRLRTISKATLIFLKPDGTAYNGSVTLRGGVYKNNRYCPDALIKTSQNETEGKNGREDITLQVTDGKLNLWFDPTQFRVDMSDEALNPQDSVAYAIEYRFEDSSYQPGYVILYAGSNYEGSAFSTDSLIQLRDIVGSPLAPQIFRMDYLQYYLNENGVYQRTPFMRSAMDFKENIGISPTYGKAVLYTDIAFPDEKVDKDEHGYSIFEGDGQCALYTASGKKLTGQLFGSPEAKQVVDLRDLDDAAFFVFPFSALPMARSVYTMTDEAMKADGITDEGENPAPTTPIKIMVTCDGRTVRSITLPFGVANLSHQPDLADRNNAAGEAASNTKTELESKIDVGQGFKNVNVNSMLKSGFTFLTGMSCQNMNSPFNLIILPTEDPGIFRIVVFIGYNQKDDSDEDGLSVNLDPNEMYEDISSLIEEETSPVSFDFRFSGTLILEAGFNFSKREWQIDFCGGSVGVGFGLKFEWSQTFFCGPVPAVISFGLKADADVKVSFISKAAVKSMLVDATINLSIEAFVGLGFDVTVAKLKLGIYGSIGADTNFLYLKKFAGGDANGTKLTINGEIGIRLEIKLLFVKYKKTFCSTGFDWTKKWGKYDSIQEQWDSNGYAELLGVTQSGRKYLMRLFSDGTALVAIDGAGELESRDYLDLYERVWNGGVNNTRNAAAMADVETNAYPDSNPVFTDDGGMFFYLSDNNNAGAVESVASYAVKSGSGYEQGKRVDTSEDNTLADLDIVASGTAATGDNDNQNSVFAAWVKQVESPEKEKGTAATYDDLGMMMNATEIYVGTYTPKLEQVTETVYIPGYGNMTLPKSIYPRSWNVERLTDNTVADMAPTVASYNSKAIVAWRSLSAAQMPEEGGSEDLTAMFNAENSINYRIGTNNVNTGKVTWTDAKVAYNGSTGTVNAIDSAMLSDGTSILVYTVRTGEDMTSTETFYTVIDKNGNVVTTGRLTNDDYTDTNVQVTAVGNQFLIGWYSEHDAGEGATQEYQFDTEGNPVYQQNGEPVVQGTKAVVAHDIRLACINANGSVDINFPESIGGTSAADISADFRFSAPAKNTNLNQVSIVWSQRKGSDVAEDAGKYELNAVRFFQEGSAIGVTAPTNIAETDQYFTIDQFDAYTDASGTVHAIVLGSDYSSVDGIHLYDTIDLSAVTKELTGENSADPSEDSLNVLEIDPVSYMKLAAGAFPAVAADVTADTDVSDLMPGVSLPVQFTVTNTGTSVIGDVTATVGGQSKTFTGLNLLPNQSTALIMCYDVPEGAVQDAAYSVVSGSTTLGSGTLTLNRPDVGISNLRILRESDGTRDIQIILSNDSDIPLAGSGKTVKLALYKDALHKNRIGEEVTITDAAALEDIDADIYTAVQTINVTDLYTGDEIPEEGLTVYAHAWVVDTEEPNIYNNDSYLKFRGLLARNNGERITADSTLEVNTNAQNEATSYTVYADIRNNSMQETELDPPVAVLLDSEGNELASENLQEEPLTLKKEERNSTLSATFKAVNGTPALAMILFRSKEKQTISAENVTATYGDTGKSVSASVTEPATGGGAIRYAVKPGSEDTIDVDASTGALTIKKAGTATVTVTAAETETHAATTKDVTVTISKANAAPATVTANNRTYDGTEKPLVNVTGEATGGTMNYAIGSDATTAPTEGWGTSIPAKTDAGTYNVWYKVVGDSNHNDTEPASVTVTISMAPPPTLTEPTLEAVTYDPSKTLADVALTGGWTWVTGTTVPTVGNTGYTAVISVDDANYDYSNVIGYDSAAHNVTRTLALTVNKATVTAPTIESKTYNAQNQTADVATSDLYTVTTNNGGTDVGSYDVVLSLSDANNYKWSDSDEAEKTLIFSIAKATNNTVSVSIEGWAYGDAANDPTAASDFGTLVITYAVKDSGEFTGEVPTDAGDYTVKATVAETANYNGGEATADFTINQKALIITADAKSKTYGEADPALTYTHSDLVGNDTITGELSRAEGENVNTYAIGQGTLTAGDNYTITYNGANLTINQKALTITAASAEKVYDAAALTKNAANDYTNTALAEGDTITSVTITGSQTVKGESSNVPSNAVIKNGNDNVTANYNITYANGTLKVTAKPITITANSAVKVYDATALTKNAANDYTNTALAEGDTITSVTITGTQTNVGTTDNVPSAAVIKHNGTDVTSSYAITYANGTLEVTPKAVTITANNNTKVYDGTALTEGGFTATALAGTDSHTFTVAMDDGSTITNFGTQPNVIATVDGTAITTGTETAVGNYLVTTVDGTLSITKLEIKGALVKLDAFEYDAATVPTAEFVNDSTVEGANGTIVEGDSAKNVTYYYKATAFLKSETENVEALEDADGVFTELTATTFEPGKHYVLAVITGDNYSNVPYITQSVFEVTQNADKERTAPTAPTVDGTKVTVAEADREKSLEYSLDGETWLSVTLDENGQFKAESENPIEVKVKLREKADKNYYKESAESESSDPVSITTFTVTYDANGGIKAPDAVTVTSDRTVTVSGKANMTRKGYTFTGWKDGSGAEVKAGDKLTNGTTLYAQWEANTYKVRFNANGGTGTMEELEFTYDAAQALTANAFSRNEYNFLGWSLTASGSVQYQDKQSVKNIAESGNITLYAVWAKDLYNVSGTIKSGNTGAITLQLVQGNIAFGELKTVEYTTAGEEVSFTLNEVPAGTYNLIAKQGDVTMTTAVIITDDHVALELITMPTGNTSSLVDVKGNDAPAVVVGGLDDVAAAEQIDDRKVTVTIAIETQNEAEAGEAGEAIVKESRAQNAEFIDFTVTKTITNKGVEESVETMTETSNVLELIIPFSFSGKSGIKLYRFHNGEVQNLEQAKGDEAKDGTYSLNQRNGFIHVFTNRFSTYAITYSNYSGSFVSDFEAIVADTEHGTITVEPQKAQAGKEVVITATPDAGYKLAELTVKDANGNEVELTENEDGTYSFTQPNGKVTIEGKFIVKFVDVPENSYYAKAVDWAVLNGITYGVDDTHFAPNASCTRAQAVTFLWRAFGCPEPTATKSEFTDVAEGAFYFKAVLWAAENGIALGYGDGTFGVDDTVNRAQMVTFMARAMKGKATTAESFIDVPESAYYADAAAWAKENGVSEGIGDNKFGGKNDCLRAQIVTMLYRYFVK